jgi:dihydroorotate dehydrogenase
MSFYRRLLFPILGTFDAESTHERVLQALALAQNQRIGRAMLRRIAGRLPQRPVEVFGLRFPNELGVAAGFDKNAEAIAGLSCLGFGHIEVGTLTPRPQKGNARPRIFRLADDNGLINRMGFPNRGIDEATVRIKRGQSRRGNTILGVSLGKQKETPLEEAARDYLEVMEQVHPYADYLAINVSSPNTPRLRELHERRHLAQLLGAVTTGNAALARRRQAAALPVLLKISPDLSWAQLDVVLEIAEEHGISGIVACNTTVSRAGLRSSRRHEIGGLSGWPLRERSTEVIGYIWKHYAGRLPIIGVGGVMSADDARQKLDAGAALVQLYTGLVYGGPGIAGQILRGL